MLSQMNYLETATRAAKAAAKHIQDSQNRTLTISTKSNPRDIVTQVDQETEVIIRNVIADAYPTHGFKGEEHGESGDSDYCWVIDPIDGTNNFARKIPHYCVSIALKEKNETKLGIIVNPANNDFYVAQANQGAKKNKQSLQVSDFQTLETAYATMSFASSPEAIMLSQTVWQDLLLKCHVLRRIGSTALELAYVAEGKVDAFLGAGQSEWDYAAGIQLVKEAGGHVKLLNEGELCLAAGTKELLEELEIAAKPFITQHNHLYR